MLDDLTESHYTVHDLIRGRWSPHAFAHRTIEHDKLLVLLEAARWAPSSYNQQPWSFVIATQDHPAEYDRLLSCLVEGNQRWAKHAPVLMLSVAKLHLDRDPENINWHAFHDVGMAVENMAIQAIALDLFVHQMAGYNREKSRELFSIPAGYEPVSMIAIGYLGNPEELPEDLRQRELMPRVRRPIEDFVFTRHWGHVSPLLNSIA
jgi:nitroreductase